MINLLELALLSLLFGIFVSCQWPDIDDIPCREEVYDDRIAFGKYYKERISGLHPDDYFIDFSQYSVYELSFYEDSSFSYLKIWHQKTEGHTRLESVRVSERGVKVAFSKKTPFFPKFKPFLSKPTNPKPQTTSQKTNKSAFKKKISFPP